MRIMILRRRQLDTMTPHKMLASKRGARSIHLIKILSNKAAFKKLSRQQQSKYPQATSH